MQSVQLSLVKVVHFGCLLISTCLQTQNILCCELQRYLEVYPSTHDDMMMRKPGLADADHIQYLREKRPSYHNHHRGSSRHQSYNQQGRGGYPVVSMNSL